MTNILSRYVIFYSKIQNLINNEIFYNILFIIYNKNA